MTLSIRSALCAISFALLSACGGGSSDSSSPPPPVSAQAPVIQAAPVANAGVDQTVFVGADVTVDGGASSDANGDPLTYRWVLSTRPAGSAATLSAATAVRPTFVADIAGQYVVTLVVNDGKTNSAADSATITALQKQAATNSLPTANAGGNMVVPVNTYVQLSGSASSDVDNDPLSYQWAIVSAPEGSLAALTDPKIVNPRFFANKVGTYAVVLRVNDGKGESLPSMALVHAVEPPSANNTAPVANAGADQFVVVKTTVFLDGTQSRDANGDALQYTWTLLSKPLASSASLTSATSSKPQFVPDVAGSYEVSLLVSDGKLNSLASDRITVVAKDSSVTPIADTGVYKCANLSSATAAYLYSIGHTYLNRDHDGHPCEANDLANEIAYPYVAPPPSNNGQCYVRGYYRKNGTYVSGYWRSCPG